MAKAQFRLSVAALLLLAATPHLGAQCLAQFDVPPSYAHGWLLELGDWNEDGSVDTLTNASVEGVLRVNFGSREGVFRRGPVATTGDARAAVAGDWNEDGHLDAVYITRDSAWFLAGTGDGSFREKQPLPPVNNPWSIAAGDFDGDDHVDVAIVELYANSVRVFWGDGHAAFDQHLSLPVDAIGIAAGDLNHDGRDDLVLDRADFDVSASLSIPNRGFAEPVILVTAGGPYGIVVRDADGDGHPDITYADPYLFLVSMFRGNGDGTFQPRADYPGGAFTEGVAFGEFTGDGALDIVAGNSIANAVAILPNEGSSYGAPSAYHAGRNIYGVRVADVNRDGRDDVIATDTGSYSILIQSEDHDFDRVETLSLPGVFRAEAADFTGDGLADLAALNFDGGQVVVLENDDRGDFRDAPAHVTQVAEGPVGAVVADLNGDAKADLVVPGALGFAFSVLLGRGDGTFDVQTRRIQAPARCAAVGDIDRDGDLDLAICAATDAEISAAASPFVRIFRNNGDGTFVPGIDVFADAPVAIAMADYDGDGRTDIAVADRIDFVGADPGKITVRFGNGDGTFGNPHDYGAGFSIEDMKAADLDGDGRPELIVSQVIIDPITGGQGVFAVYANEGGTFELARTLHLNGQNFWITIADVNGDDRPDLAGGNGGLVYAFHNRGRLRFDTGDSYRVSDDPTNVAAADFNGDGRIDLAVTSAFETLAVLFNETVCRPRMRSVRK